MFYIYLIKKGNGQLYIGFTANLKRRLEEHKARWGQLKLIYFEAYNDEFLARVREKKLKMYGSAYRALKRRLHLYRA